MLLPPLYSVRQRARTDLPGMSVGLAICKSFVEAHHGRVWVDERAGGGSVFHFAVPMRDREEQARLGPGDRPRKKEPRYS